MISALIKVIRQTVGFPSDTDQPESFKYYPQGVKIDNKNTHADFKWTEVSQINVFKTDLITVESLEMQIVCQKKIFSINEDFSGWTEFVIKIKEIFPTIPAHWDIDVLQIPFQAKSYDDLTNHQPMF